MNDVPVLVTIPASNYVEKARWALQLAQISFKEEKHAPVFHRFSTKPKGGRSVPLLFFPSNKIALKDSSDIVDLCAKTLPSLYPTPEAKELERRLDTDFGPHTRRTAYFFLFKDDRLGRALITAPANGWFERLIASICYPYMKKMMSQFMNINEAATVISLEHIEKIVAEVEGRLGDGPFGSRFLVGDTFSAADIAFCAHFGLLLAPPENVYIGPLVVLGPNGDPLRVRIEKLQQSRAAEYVRWCYKNYRPPMAKL